MRKNQINKKITREAWAVYDMEGTLATVTMSRSSARAHNTRRPKTYHKPRKVTMTVTTR